MLPRPSLSTIQMLAVPSLTCPPHWHHNFKQSKKTLNSVATHTHTTAYRLESELSLAQPQESLLSGPEPPSPGRGAAIPLPTSPNAHLRCSHRSARALPSGQVSFPTPFSRKPPMHARGSFNSAPSENSLPSWALALPLDGSAVLQLCS